MRMPYEQIVEMTSRCGFSRAVLLPAREIDEYVPNATETSPVGEPSCAGSFDSPRRAQVSGIECDPEALLPNARSVLMLAVPFTWYSAWPEASAEVSAYYEHSQRAHSGVLELAAQLSSLGAAVNARQALPLKLLARNAGFGVIGRNTLVRNDAWGSCMALRILTTDIEPAGELAAIQATPCGTCRLCVDACPTGALDGNGGLHIDRCLRHYMLSNTPTPMPLRTLVGTRLVGCEMCQRACPHNLPLRCVAPEPAPFSIDDLLAANRHTMTAIASRIGKNYARRPYIQAQAALAAGNSGDRQYLSALELLSDSDHRAVREHARWAVDRLRREFEGTAPEILSS